MNENYGNAFTSIQEFFENSEYLVLVQWKARYEIRLNHLKEDRINCNEAKQYVKTNQECHLKLEDLQKNHRQEILKQLKELSLNAKQTKVQLNDQQLEEKFDENGKVGHIYIHG